MTTDEITGHAEICAGLADAIQRGEDIDPTVLLAALTDAAAIIRELNWKYKALEHEAAMMFIEAMRRWRRYLRVMTPRDGAPRLRMTAEILQMLQDELNVACKSAGCLSCPDCDSEFFEVAQIKQERKAA